MKKKINHLLLFTYGISLEDWDNWGIISREIALYKQLLKKNEINVKFITFGKDNDLKYTNLLEKIEIIPVGKQLSFRLPKMHFFKSLLLPLKLSHVFKEADIIKTNQISGCWIACIAKILFRKKIIIRGGYELLNRHIILSNKKGIKNCIKYVLIYFWIFIIELIAYKLADGIILANDQDINFIIKCFRLKKKKNNQKIRHFFNYIDVNLFRPLYIPKNNKKILFIGRLTPQKNLYNLLYAFKDLKDFNLDILGKGPCKRKMVEIIKKYKINVNFLDILPNYRIPDLMNQYQIFILPSYWEGNPKVLLEAMSCEVACIGTNINGINNILKHKQNGYLCEPTNNSIRDAILLLYNNDELREKIGKNARIFILKNCSLSSISEKEFLFYKNILK